MKPKRWQFIEEEDKFDPQHHRLCDHVGCEDKGEFRAPKNRADLRSYFFFCLTHVQAYNQAWNFYEGMSEDQIEANRRDDVTWQRKTWPFTASEDYNGGGKGKARAYSIDDLADPFEFLKDADSPSKNTSTQSQNRNRLPAEVNAALDLFQIEPPVKEEELRSRYKKLAKQFHPDMNQGDAEKEEIFKRLNAAYDELKKSMFLINGL